MQEFEFIGEWWLPNSEDKIIGTIKFDPINGAYLEMKNGFFSSGDSDLPILDIQIILGEIERNKKVTLYQCICMKHTIGNYHSGEATYFIHLVFIGCHFNKPENIIFDKIFIEYRYLLEWLNQNLFKISDTSNSNVSVTYEVPKSIDIQLEDFDIHIHQGVERRENLAKIELIKKAYIEIIFDEPLHFDKIESINYHLQNFFTLAIEQPVIPIQVIGEISNEGVEKSGGIFFTKFLPYIEIFYRPIGATSMPLQSIIHKMLFTYNHIAPNIEKYIQIWFEKIIKLGIFYDLFFELSYSESKNDRFIFLTLAQGIEAYHRQVHGGQYMTESEYEKIKIVLINAIPSEVSKDHREKLKGIISYGYEYALRKRLKLLLKEILSPYKPIVDSLVGNIDKFIQAWVNIRNHLTHYSNKADEDIFFYGLNFGLINQTTLFLARLCFFIELGFDIQIVNEILEKNYYFTQIIKHEKWWLNYTANKKD